MGFNSEIRGFISYIEGRSAYYGARILSPLRKEGKKIPRPRDTLHDYILHEKNSRQLKGARR